MVAAALLWDRWGFRVAAAVLAVLVALGFLVPSGGVGFFGNPKYWPRKLHGIAYLVFGVLVLTVPEYAWVALLVDIAMGMYVVANYYGSKI